MFVSPLKVHLTLMCSLTRTQYIYHQNTIHISHIIYCSGWSAFPLAILYFKHFPICKCQCRTIHNLTHLIHIFCMYEEYSNEPYLCVSICIRLFIVQIFIGFHFVRSIFRVNQTVMRLTKEFKRSDIKPIKRIILKLFLLLFPLYFTFWKQLYRIAIISPRFFFAAGLTFSTMNMANGNMQHGERICAECMHMKY